MFEPTTTTADVDGEIRAFRQRPLLMGALTLAFLVFAVWYMNGGSATGSTSQAEQLIRAHPNGYPEAQIPGVISQPAVVQTVNCTQNSQSFFSRLAGLVSSSSSNSPHNRSTGPATYYTCGGTSATGLPLYWCVTFAPRNGNGVQRGPWVSGRQPDGRCPL